MLLLGSRWGWRTEMQIFVNQMEIWLCCFTILGHTKTHPGPLNAARFVGLDSSFYLISAPKIVANQVKNWPFWFGPRIVTIPISKKIFPPKFRYSRKSPSLFPHNFQVSERRLLLCFPGPYSLIEFKIFDTCLNKIIFTQLNYFSLKLTHKQVDFKTIFAILQSSKFI